MTSTILQSVEKETILEMTGEEVQEFARRVQEELTAEKNREALLGLWEQANPAPKVIS